MSDKSSETKECEYCKESITKKAKKCKVCGEPCYFFWGKAWKFTPLMLNGLPLVFAIVTGLLAMTERRERQVVERVNVEISRKLDGAEQANWELARKLPEASAKEIRNGIIRDFRLLPGSRDETLRQLEKKAKATPENAQVQKNLYMFRALKSPD